MFKIKKWGIIFKSRVDLGIYYTFTGYEVAINLVLRSTIKRC
jgi:hypothetical protein